MARSGQVKQMRHRPHWYKIYMYECPVCGRSEEIRERVYCDDQPKPDDPAERHIYEISYDWCDY